MRKNKRSKHYVKGNNRIAMMNIELFCKQNNIHFSGDSYYFEIDGQKYRVSNHSVDESNRRAFNKKGEQVRKLYHPEGELDDVIYIQAGKRRIIWVYNNLKNGYVVSNTIAS